MKSDAVSALSTNDDRDRCPSCRVLWTQHMGIQGTCAELLEAQLNVELAKSCMRALLDAEAGFDMLPYAQTAFDNMREGLRLIERTPN